MSNFEIFVMNAPKRNIHRSILENYMYDKNVTVHTEKAQKVFIPYIDKLQYDMRRIFINILKKFLKTDKAYLMILQDDMVLGKNFKKAIEYIVSTKPQEMIFTFFSPFDLRAMKRDEWAVLYNKTGMRNLRGCATLMRRELVVIIIEENEHILYDQHWGWGDDTFLRLVLMKREIGFVHTKQSFTQHGVVKSALSHLPMYTKVYNKKLDLLEYAKVNYPIQEA